jgi:hypothetical protein
MSGAITRQARSSASVNLPHCRPEPSEQCNAMTQLFGSRAKEMSEIVIVPTLVD